MTIILLFLSFLKINARLLDECMTIIQDSLLMSKRIKIQLIFSLFGQRTTSCVIYDLAVAQTIKMMIKPKKLNSAIIFFIFLIKTN